MKKIVIFLPALLAIWLAGCASLGKALPSEPETVKIDGRTYRQGFYGDLWTESLAFTGEQYEVGGKTFRRADCAGFDCMQALGGGKTGGIVYCLDSQWEEAAAYYGDAENYTYYCQIDALQGGKQVFEIEAMDFEKFDALAHIGSVFSYDPFDIVKNKASESREILIDAAETDPRPYIVFYRESKDGSFVSSKAHRFFLLGGEMYLARYHNMSEGTVSAVKVPEETAAYFIELITRFQES